MVGQAVKEEPVQSLENRLSGMSRDELLQQARVAQLIYGLSTHGDRAVSKFSVRKQPKRYGCCRRRRGSIVGLLTPHVYVEVACSNCKGALHVCVWTNPF